LLLGAWTAAVLQIWRQAANACEMAPSPISTALLKARSRWALRAMLLV
jgi:hypothetical protein